MRIETIFRFLLAFSLTVFVSPEPSRAQDCVSGGMLTLKDSQGGFAGTTGSVWVIGADCRFTVARFINEDVKEPHQRGQLSAKQQGILTALVADKAVANLPATIGVPAPVNAHTITLEYAGKTWVLHLAPGPADVERIMAEKSDSAARRLLEIAAGVKDITGARE